MNGQKHYLRAELYLTAADDMKNDPALAARYASIALVHATLANAAATAIGGLGLEAQKWMDVAGTRPSDDS